MDNKLEKDIIKKLQGDLPLTAEPYKAVADELGISEKQVLEQLEILMQKRILRRVAGILNHKTAGFEANAMVVWKVAPNDIEEAANLMSSFDAVSHCYQRETLPEWPYNLYTMIHGKNFKVCEETIQQIAGQVQINEYEVLYSTRELKKSSMCYFI